MKVIDLLNKIANGNLPDKTKFKVFSSCNDKNDKPFICQYDESYPGIIWCIENDYKFNYKIEFMRILNYKVEILEDTTEEIEEYQTKYTERCIDKEVREKLNEVIRFCNKLNNTTYKAENCMTD